MKLNSTINSVNISDNQLFEKLTAIENFKKIMPENISKFEIIDNETLIFSLKGMPAIKLIIDERNSPSKIVMKSSESKIIFSLTANIQKIDNDSCNFELEFNGDLNPMIQMMVKSPLQSFINDLSNNISSDNRIQSITGDIFPCENGMANNYECNNLDLMAFLTPANLTNGSNTELNDIWGWTDALTDKEYALVGLRLGTSFVDVTDPVNPIVLGVLPTQTNSSTWRDIKVYKDHAFIVADNAGSHGVQIFDLTQLRGVTDFTVFETTYHYDKVGSVHNIAINEDTGFAYAVGIGSASESQYVCGAHIININDPSDPSFAGCLSDNTTGRGNDGYVHDGQFVIYKGPDTKYFGKEIAFTANETALGIADVTDKSNLKIISKFDQSKFECNINY